MIEVIIIISLSVVFIILLRRLPEVKFETVQPAPSHMIITSKFVSGEKITKLWIKANSELERKDYTKAEKLYLKIAALDPKNPKIYGKLGIIYLEQRNFLDAKEAFFEATKKEPQNAYWYNNLGLALYNLKRFSESIEAYKKSLAIDNAKAVRFFNLGLAYEALGEFKQALNSYKRAAALEPEDTEFQNLISRIEKEIKNPIRNQK